MKRADLLLRRKKIIFIIQEQSWFKRRDPYLDRKQEIGDFEIIGFEKEDRSLCKVIVIVDDVTYTIEGRVAQNVTYEIDPISGEHLEVPRGWHVHAIQHPVSLIFKLVE